jgi:hypothetical protein
MYQLQGTVTALEDFCREDYQLLGRMKAMKASDTCTTTMPATGTDLLAERIILPASRTTLTATGIILTAAGTALLATGIILTAAGTALTAAGTALLATRSSDFQLQGILYQVQRLFC